MNKYDNIPKELRDQLIPVSQALHNAQVLHSTKDRVHFDVKIVSPNGDRVRLDLRVHDSFLLGVLVDAVLVAAKLQTGDQYFLDHFGWSDDGEL